MQWNSATQRDRAQSSSRSLWHERNPLLALVADSFPPCEKPSSSADIAAFNLSEEGQLLLKVWQGMEMQWRVMVLRSVEDLTVVFERNGQHGGL